MNIDKTLKNKKRELLAYFRDRASESLNVIKTKYAETQGDKRAKAINERVNETKEPLAKLYIGN